MRTPSVCVVATIKNDARGLKALLRDLQAQTLQPHHVVLAVAQSDDASLAVAQEAQKTWGERLLVLPLGNVTRAEGRNQAVQRTACEVIAFTDAGCHLDPGWLAALALPFTNDEVQLVSGVTYGHGRTAFERAQIPFVLVDPSAYEQHPLPATRNMAIRRMLFLRSGGFPAQLNTAEDYAFARDLRSQGVHALLVPDAKVTWRPRKNLTKFFLMIAALTQGDVIAGTWRRAHIVLPLRWLVSLGGGLLIAWWFGWLPGAMWFISLTSVFVGYKVWRLSRRGANSWTPLLQLACDAAVIVGILAGLLSRVKGSPVL